MRTVALIILTTFAYVVGYNTALDVLADRVEAGQQTIIEKSAHVACDIRNYMVFSPKHNCSQL